VYTFAYTLATGCAYALRDSEDCFYYYSSRNNVVVLFGTFKVQPFINVQFVHLALGERVWGGSVSL